MRIFFGVQVIAVLLTMSTRAWCSAGAAGAAFLEIPSGAAPAALGSAYSALATDAHAPVWNPAGLGFLEAPSFAGQHLSYLETLRYEFAAFVLPLGPSTDTGSRSGLGLSIQYLTSGDIAATDQFGRSLGDYSARFASYNAA